MIMISKLLLNIFLPHSHCLLNLRFIIQKSTLLPVPRRPERHRPGWWHLSCYIRKWREVHLQTRTTGGSVWEPRRISTTIWAGEVWRIQAPPRKVHPHLLRSYEDVQQSWVGGRRLRPINLQWTPTGWEQQIHHLHAGYVGCGKNFSIRAQSSRFGSAKHCLLSRYPQNTDYRHCAPTIHNQKATRCLAGFQCRFVLWVWL